MCLNGKLISYIMYICLQKKNSSRPYTLTDVNDIVGYFSTFSHRHFIYCNNCVVFSRKLFCKG